MKHKTVEELRTEIEQLADMIRERNRSAVHLIGKAEAYSELSEEDDWTVGQKMVFILRAQQYAAEAKRVLVV